MRKNFIATGMPRKKRLLHRKIITPCRRQKTNILRLRPFAFIRREPRVLIGLLRHVAQRWLTKQCHRRFHGQHRFQIRRRPNPTIGRSARTLDHKEPLRRVAVGDRARQIGARHCQLRDVEVAAVSVPHEAPVRAAHQRHAHTFTVASLEAEHYGIARRDGRG